MGFFEQWTTILPKKGILRIPHHSIFQQIYAGTIRKKLHAASLTFLLDSRSPSGRENITISPSTSCGRGRYRTFRWRASAEECFGTGATIPLARESEILAKCVQFVCSASSSWVQHLAEHQFPANTISHRTAVLPENWTVWQGVKRRYTKLQQNPRDIIGKNIFQFPFIAAFTHGQENRRRNLSAYNFKHPIRSHSRANACVPANPACRS